MKILSKKIIVWPLASALIFSQLGNSFAKEKTWRAVGHHLEDAAGKRYRGKERLMKIGPDYYDVKADGSLRRGWNIFNHHLYYFGSHDRAVRHRVVDGIRLSEDGTAIRNLDAQLRYQTLKTLKSLVSLDASKSTKLRAVYNYLGSRRHFGYQMKYPRLSSKTWIKDYAYYMLNTHRGNCYGFASTFSAFAYTIGYRHIAVMTGRVHGNRDHAADGLTRHAWVRIGHYYYDPELNWHGNGAYHRSGYVRANHAYSYDKQPGSRMIHKAKTKYDYYKQGKFYYGIDASSRALHGIYAIDDHLFMFDQQGKMRVHDYRILAKMAKEKAPWEKLEKKLGKGKKVSTADSCYGEGKDIVYRYPHVEFSVFAPADGQPLIVESFNAR